MRELVSSVPDWLIPSGPEHVLFAYLADEDATIVPVVGEQVRFLPELASHMSHYAGGPVVAMSAGRLAMPAYQLTGRRHSVSDGGILVDIGFPVEAQEFPDVVDEVAFAGSLEIPTWGSTTDAGASTWRVIALAGRCSSGEPIKVPSIVHPDDRSPHYLVLCALEQAGDL